MYHSHTGIIRGRSVQLDLLAALLLIGLLALWLKVWPQVDSPLRIGLALVVALVVPGYTLMIALFPKRSDLDFIERVALSLGLSVVPITLTGLLLSYTPWGIQGVPMAIGLLLITLLTSGIAFYRRKRLSPNEWFYPSFAGSSRLFALAAGVVVVGAILVFLLRPNMALTEFYLLGPENRFEGYQVKLVPGQQLSVKVGVHNQEGRTLDYIVRAGGVEVRIPALANGQTWENTLTIPAPQGQGRTRLPFELYRQGDTQPYRQVYLILYLQPERSP